MNKKKDAKKPARGPSKGKGSSSVKKRKSTGSKLGDGTASVASLKGKPSFEENKKNEEVATQNIQVLDEDVKMEADGEAMQANDNADLGPPAEASRESFDSQIMKSFFQAGNIKSDGGSKLEDEIEKVEANASPAQEELPGGEESVEQVQAPPEQASEFDQFGAPLDSQLWEDAQQILEEQNPEPAEMPPPEEEKPIEDTELEAEHQMDEILNEQLEQKEEHKPSKGPQNIKDFVAAQLPGLSGNEGFNFDFNAAEPSPQHQGSSNIESAQVMGGGMGGMDGGFPSFPMDGDINLCPIDLPQKHAKKEEKPEPAAAKPVTDREIEDLGIDLGPTSSPAPAENADRQDEQQKIFGEGENNYISDLHEGRFTMDQTQYEEIGFFDNDEDILPLTTLNFTEDQQSKVMKSWTQVKQKGAVTFDQQVMDNFNSIRHNLGQDEQEEELMKIFAEHHSTKLLNALDTTITRLGNKESISKLLKSLGKRHRKHGVKKEQYNAMCKAIMATMEARLVNDFDPNIKNTWVKFFKGMKAWIFKEGDDESESLIKKKEGPKSSNHVSDTTKPSKQESFVPKKTSSHGDQATEMGGSSEISPYLVPDSMIFRLQKDEEKVFRLTVAMKKHILMTWPHIVSDETMGPKLYVNLFNAAPDTLKLFPFRNVKNLMQSQQLKAHGNKILGLIGNVVLHLNDLDLVMPSLSLFGEQHIAWRVSFMMFEIIALAGLQTFREKLGDEYTMDVHEAYRVMFNIIIEIMLIKWERKSYMDQVVVEKDEFELRQNSIGLGLANMMTNIANRKSLGKDQPADVPEAHTIESSTSSITTEPTIKDSEESIKIEVRKNLLIRMRNEVDFHHKMCFRFEKAYRLDKLGQHRKQQLNLELIECIGDHSNYIAEDPMSIFYCLFFCIFYNNQEFIEFLREVIQKVPTFSKIDTLLEIIDTQGIEKIRDSQEQINVYVYHMVFYQAVDDNLRVVYSQILRKLRFIQLRDKDALQLLNQRDYELIKLAFTKYTTKVNIKEFKTKAQKSATYRQYNQAYFEEIVINNEIESRVAMNYRERFLVTPEDIYIVFEMYCKEDYYEQFMQTKKDAISHKQFVDLFVICLRHDSFRIAILIYTLYLNPQVDLDERIMNILIQTIRESIKYHEPKLFFLHEHFDTLSTSQLNRLVDIYQELLSRKEPQENPMISQFNTIKITLLIYRICWKIEEKQIYSLITKCSLLNSYLISSLSQYLENQSNVLTLYKFMREPILHMTERKDSLDIMYEMNMQELLHHPVVVEVLNFVAEGKYSVSSSALSMVSTFNCLLDMDTFHEKSVMDRLVANITNFGDIHNGKQSSLQFNIWKQSIQQRERDEMIFTVFINLSSLLFAMSLTLIHNESYQTMQETFGQNYNRIPNFAMGISETAMAAFCEKEVDSLLNEAPVLRTFSILVAIVGLGALVSFFQKLLTFKFRNNVDLSIGHTILQLFMVFSATLFFIVINKEPWTFISASCTEHLDMSLDDQSTADYIYMMRDPTPKGLLKFQIILSLQIVEASLSLILMLKRTHYLGELIMMLQIMGEELLRFFSTFGIVIVFALIFGHLIGQEIKENSGSFYKLFLDLFDAFNGNHDFADFIKPTGHIYIGAFMYVFKVLLLSLLAAMFINKYDQVYFNLDAIRRFNIIRQKNSIAYDQQVGGATITFFPINIIMGPFLGAIFLMKSTRFSDFALKIQYSLLVLFYALLGTVLILPSIPLLYLKSLTNIGYIILFRKRHDYPGQTARQAATTIFLGIPIILVSIMVDFFSLPGMLLKSSSKFEHKYQQQGHDMTRYQIVRVNNTLDTVGENYVARFKGESMTLLEMMAMHTKIFQIIENLHDLTCIGHKNYKEALSNVQDYNMTKVLSEKCSIPDKHGDLKQNRCHFDQIVNVRTDILLFNYVDVQLRKVRMNTLRSDMRASEEHDALAEEKKHVKKTKEQRIAEKMKMTAKKEEDPDNEEEDLDQLSHIIDPQEVGPDGVNLWRNMSDVMNNFFINVVCKAFTDIEKESNALRARSEKALARKMEEKLAHQQVVWREMTQGVFLSQADRVKKEIKSQVRDVKQIQELQKIRE